MFSGRRQRQDVVVKLVFNCYIVFVDRRNFHNVHDCNVNDTQIVTLPTHDTQILTLPTQHFFVTAIYCTNRAVSIYCTNFRTKLKFAFISTHKHTHNGTAVP